MDQRPIPRAFPYPHKPPEFAALEHRVEEQISSLSNRVRVVEDRLNSINLHLELIDNTLLEKHKAVVSEVRKLQGDVRQLRGAIAELRDLTERIIRRLEAFASKEQVKVLERYIDIIQPLNFVTRSEIRALVTSILKEKGIVK